MSRGQKSFREVARRMDGPETIQTGKTVAEIFKGFNILRFSAMVMHNGRFLGTKIWFEVEGIPVRHGEVEDARRAISATVRWAV